MSLALDTVALEPAAKAVPSPAKAAVTEVARRLYENGLGAVFINAKNHPCFCEAVLKHGDVHIVVFIHRVLELSLSMATA